MRGEIRALQRRLGITAVYVTHDQIEALAMSDLIAVMSEGQVVEHGAPHDLYDRPRSRFAAEFIGAANLVPLVDPALHDGVWMATAPWGPVALAGQPAATPAHLLIRPEDIHLVTDGAALPNVWDARVVDAAFLGAYQRCRVQVGPLELVAHFPRRARARPGQRVKIHVPAEHCVALG